MTPDPRPVAILGGAGFIGANLAAHLARAGHRVRIYDDLSRAGVERNLDGLRRAHGDRIEAVIADVRDRARLRAALADTAAVFHLAGQTAVTTSLVDPRADFEINAAGTLEVLEALRAQPAPPPLVFTSTNKVYGTLPDLYLITQGARWRPVDEAIHARGIDERRRIEPRTPYGCSKAAADQYVLDYAHGFGLPAVVFRMSCIYGPHQLGTEDQGWIAHFLIRALAGASITIYGDGRQVRDVLHVDDLVDAFLRAWRQIDLVRGCAFNIGGGPHQTSSLLELIESIARLSGRRPEVRFEDWRAGDQRYYVSDTTAFTTATGWRPQIAPRAGVEALHGWLREAAHA
ncbi:MAG TPA: NAD-dependent epimerase/dehydratase family protein [Kofleriaceae bacterium]|nr:NAD-dependent epimerase/dehydratase family protein [Kofleriaceae bacterium]